MKEKGVPRVVTHAEMEAFVKNQIGLHEVGLLRSHRLPIMVLTYPIRAPGGAVRFVVRKLVGYAGKLYRKLNVKR